MFRTLVVFALLWLAAAATPAHAVTTVRVAATDPPGETITLAPNQHFYLLLDFATDQPASIWVRPYYEGHEVAAGSNPSRRHAGSGQALGWFFLMQPGDRVDEVRISAGDGSIAGTHVVASWPVRIAAGATPAAQHALPEWAARLQQADAAAQRADVETRMRTPPGAGETTLFNGFMLLMFAIGFAGIVAPAVAAYRWRGRWRLLAALPALAMGFVLIRLLVDTTRDPTSHNLWPFEIVMTGAACAGAVFVLALLRRFAGERR